MKRLRTSITVLLSGGLDSSACVAFYLSQNYRVSTLFVDYGQSASEKEKKAARQVAKHFKVSHSEIFQKGASKKSLGAIAARNAFLIMTALMESHQTTDFIAIGIHAGTPYYDCTQSFLNSIQGLTDGYTDGKIKITAPFINMGKSDIWQYIKSISLPIELTYSCQKGGKKPCGKCGSCHDRRKLDALPS